MKRHTLLYLLSPLLLLCAFLALPARAQQQACVPPVLPKSTEPNIFSEEQEVYLGEAVAESIQKDYRVIEDAELTGYLARIGERLAKNLPIKGMRFQFFLVDLPNANAFVLPGGRIYVSRKLVALSESEDELAGVIAHELGHLAARESAIYTTRLFKELLGVTEVRDRRDVFEKYNQMIDNVMRKPGLFRRADREKGQMVADQIGLFALVSAGYDPQGLVRFWDRATEAKGKTGSWFSDLFGTTRPEERRLREMIKTVESLPAACKEPRATAQAENYKKWQSAVISYTGLGRKETLPGVISKQQLEPPLRSDITHLRFSPDGKYVLAQDDSGINVLTREPFANIFRIEASDAYPANFSPDSQSIVFYTENLRVERWSVADQKMTDVKEVVVRKGCLQTALSPDGKYLACLGPEFHLSLIDTQTGQTALQKKDFFRPGFFHVLMLYELLVGRGRGDSSDFGLKFINMKFSPDGRYFVAGYAGRDHMSTNLKEYEGEAVDMTTLGKVAIPDSMKKLIAGGFTFIGSDRLVGINREDYKKSAVVTFPKGDIVADYQLRGELIAPTRGNYLIIRPVKDFALGVMDLNTKVIFKANKQPALDIYGDIFVAEMRNGQLGLYRVEKNEVIATALLSNYTLGRLNVAELSPDMKWLALSGRSRGGVWNLGNKAEAALYVRAFRGGYLSNDGYFFGDFPQYETAERNVARFSLANGEIVPGAKIEAQNARQVGRYLMVVKSAKEAKEGEAVPYGQYSKNVRLEMQDARTLAPLWSRAFPKDAPRIWVAAYQETVALLWDVTDEAAKLEIKADERLSRQLAAMKEKEGDYLVEILDARNGKLLGKLLIETGKGSFRLSNVFAAGDWVIVTDTQNRVLVYSLKTGEQRGRVFGAYATVSPASGLLCVENESGKLTVYNLNTMERREQYVFSNPVSLVRFSEDGRRLFVLTSNQTAYVLDTSSLANNSSTA